MNFQNLVDVIVETQRNLQGRALRSVDHFLTMRNWLIGFYLVEYEQGGSDRARYGAHLLEKLADSLRRENIRGMSFRSLKLFRQFYRAYPQIGQSLIAQFKLTDLKLPATIGQSLSAQLAGKVLPGAGSPRLLDHLTPTRPELLLCFITASCAAMC